MLSGEQNTTNMLLNKAQNISENDVQERESVPSYFAGKNIFITGGSGFIGKVLIEKILRDCPNVGKIYFLIRSKKGKSIHERVKEIIELPLFKLVRKADATRLEKIIPIEGDVKELGLGMSLKDRETIINNANIIYHSAASIRFDDFLKTAILMNTRSAREVSILAQQVKNLSVFMHVSTTYCNTDRKVIDEEMYPPHADWKESIKLAESYDENVLDILTAKYLGKLPNTYTFTKSMAEHAVDDLCNNKIPTIILRPSIVIPTLKEPVTGWMDNFNGPIGLCIATGKGILRSVYTKPTTLLEYIPVDVVARCMIIATWEKGTNRDIVEKNTLKIYNCSNNNFAPTNYKELMEMGGKMYKDLPLNNIVWYPDNKPTACYYYHFYKLVVYQLLPALIIDAFLKVMGKKSMLFKLHRRIYIANMALQYFLSQDWIFPNGKMQALDDLILPEDQDNFTFCKHLGELSTFDYFWDVKVGARKYLLNEPKETLEAAKKHTMRMYYIYILWNIIWYVTLFWFIMFKIDISSLLVKKFDDTIVYFNTP